MPRQRRSNLSRRSILVLRRTRDLSSAHLNRAAFRYDCSNDYSLHPSFCIGQMDVVCKYCGALKFSGETPGLCCLSGKVKLPLLTPPPEPLNACLKSSILWKYIKTLKLSINMRVELQEDQSGEVFSKQLLDIGNGNIAVDTSSGYITFPTNFCNFCESKIELMEMVFPNIAQNYVNHVWLSERVILAAKNVDVNEMNFQIQEKIAGELKNYKSVDSVTNEDKVVNYPTNKNK